MASTTYRFANHDTAVLESREEMYVLLASIFGHLTNWGVQLESMTIVSRRLRFTVTDPIPAADVVIHKLAQV